MSVESLLFEFGNGGFKCGWLAGVNEVHTALLKEEKLSMTFTYVIESSSSFSNAVWRGEYIRDFHTC